MKYYVYGFQAFKLLKNKGYDGKLPFGSEESWHSRRQR